MIRTQVLLTTKQILEIENLSKEFEISKSSVIRDLLDKVLHTQTKTEARDVSDSSVYKVDAYEGKDPRINGLKELYTVGASIADTFVIGHQTFKYYIENNELPKLFRSNLLQVARELVQSSLTGKLVLRRAFIVPGLENPPGPRFLGISPEEMESSLIELYNFALENKYTARKGAEIAAFLYPFADPEPIEVPVKQDAVLPYGGYAHPLNDKASRVEVLGVWGNNEGVQSFDAIDSYIVDTDENIILEKKVPQKSVMLVTTKSSQSEKLNVPTSKQFKQVLNDFEILKCAKIVSDLTAKYGPRRIEYSYDGIKGLQYNESITYTMHRNITHEINMKGKIVTISNHKDLDRIKEGVHLKSDTILYIDPCIMESRNYDLLNSVAGLKKKFTVFYPGLSSTAHAMRVLTDFGHTAIVVGNRKFEENEEVLLKTDASGEIIIKKAHESRFVQNLYDAKLFGVDMVGGKALNLSLLKGHGFNVPHGVVLTTDFFMKVLKDHKLDLEKFIKNPIHLSINQDLWNEIMDSQKLDQTIKYSVRSSATVEDQRNHSFAGQFTTELNITYEGLKEATESVLNSVSTDSVKKYLQAYGDKQMLFKMAVVVQEMIDPIYAGVIFSKDIRTMNSDHIIIEMKTGTAEGVVDGTSLTTKAVFSRNESEIITKPDLSIVPITTPELEALISMTKSIEDSMGGPQDIEWAIDHSGKFWVLQSRDI